MAKGAVQARKKRARKASKEEFANRFSRKSKPGFGQRKVYSDRLNLSLFEQTKQSQIEANFVRAPNEEHHCQIGKGDEEDRFGRCAVVQKGTNSTDPSISGKLIEVTP